MPLAEPRCISDLSKCFFYHTIDVPGVGHQRGQWDLRGRFDDYIGNIQVAGRRVLDVGCASGFLSFCAEQRGASEVYSFDMDHAGRQHKLPFRDSLYFSDHAKWVQQQDAWVEQWKNAYWLVHRQIGSQAKVFYGDVYDLTLEYGLFDVVLVGSILEHLSDPVRALASISKLSRSTIVVTTPVIESEDRIANFLGDANRPEIDYVFWVYSVGVYRHVFRMLGFAISRIVSNSFLCELTGCEVRLTTIVAEREAERG